jgi:hypothetical protein
MPALTFIFALNHHRLFAIFNHHGCLHSSANVTMSRAMSKVFDRMAAHHEAGHAVAFVIFGVTFEYVRLDRDGSGGGAVFAPGERLRIIPSKGLDHDQIRRRIVCQIAGPFAQDRFKKIHRYRHCKSAEDPACNDDWKTAFSLGMLLICTSDDYLKDDAKYDEVQAIMEERAAVAEKLVADHWSSVQAVAEALLERGRLTYAEVRALVHVRDADRNTCNRRSSQPLPATLASAEPPCAVTVIRTGEAARPRSLETCSRDTLQKSKLRQEMFRLRPICI